MSTDFVIIRHGQTDWNLAKRIQGSTDIPLNDIGVQQALATRDALVDREFDAVASSQLQRAAFTAATINEPHDKQHHVDTRLAERAFGSVEGWTVEQVNAAFGSFEAIADIESWHAVGERMLSALVELADAYPNGHVLVVAHGSSIRAVIGAIQGLPPREVQSMWNCSVSEVRYDNGKWSLLSVNDNSHLPEELRS